MNNKINFKFLMKYTGMILTASQTNLTTEMLLTSEIQVFRVFEVLKGYPYFCDVREVCYII